MKRSLIVFLAATMLLGACGYGPDEEVSSAPKPTPAPTVTVTPPPEIKEVEVPQPISDEQIAEIIKEAYKEVGFKEGEVKVGDEVVFEGTPIERGESSSFSKNVIRTRGEMARFLKVSKKARHLVWDALKDLKGEFKRALDGSGYFPVQWNVPVQYLGTTYKVGGKVLSAPVRQTEAEDILWVFMTKEGVPVFGASIRADCGNPRGFVVPVRGRPPAPPIQKDPSLSFQYDSHATDKVQGSGVQDGPGKKGENKNPDQESGCNHDGCDGDGTEPKPPKDPPPPDEDGTDPEVEDDDQHTGKPPQPE